MSKISSLFIRKVVAAGSDRLDKPALLRGMRVDPDAPLDFDEMVPGEGYFELLETIAAAEDGPVLFHLRAGASMRCDEYGVLGLAIKSAPTLKGSYERVVRYGELLISTPLYYLEERAEGTCIALNRFSNVYGIHLSNEAAMATFWALSQETLGSEFTPAAVYYAHEAPEHAELYREHFGCPVHFSSSLNGFCVPSDIVEKRNRVGDEALAGYFDAQLEERVAQASSERSLESLVRVEVGRSLSGGVPKKGEIAQLLGVSERTLNRRLADQGLSFQAIVEESRRELAEGLLRRSSYSLAEVAFMTGFSEQSAFTRAFKRWTDHTPGSYRLASAAR